MLYGMGTLKIPLQSIHSKEGPHYCLGAKRKEAVRRQATINLFTSLDILWWFHTWAVLHSLANTRKCQLEDFVRKKGMNHVQSNVRSQQMPSAKFGKEKTYRWWSYYQVPMSVLLWETHAFCSRNMGVHVQCTSAKKLVSSNWAKILKVANKIRETCEKTLFTPSSRVKATKLYRFCLSNKRSPKSPINV
jgi:hypothetical protein